MKRTRSALIARQQDLRADYGRNPTDALTTKRVRSVQTPSTDAVHGTVIADGFANSAWAYGIDAKVGGLDDLPNPGHLLCAALAACMDSTIRMLAERLGVILDELEIEIVGDVDVRGCMAMEPSIRPGFRSLDCNVRCRPAAATDPKTLALLFDHAERLCVTLDTLRNGVPITVSADTTPPPIRSISNVS
jgi:uncharacterized OsmC-like protein